MLADFRRCCCGLATNVAAECRDGCKFLEISGVFYKLMALAGEFGIDLAPDHGWHDRPSGSQTHESILAFRQAWLHGNNHGGRKWRSFSRHFQAGIAPIAMHHWEEISLIARGASSGSGNFIGPPAKASCRLTLVPTMPFSPWLGSAALPPGVCF
jgi:hypothetical protein